jgi:SAM-dependent methyltransferase
MSPVDTPAQAGLSPQQQRQEDQYAYPYHYLAHERGGAWHVSRSLGWGYEQLALINAVLGTVERLRPASLLDFGCGDGRLLYELRRRGQVRRLAGVDFSRRSLALASGLHAADGGEGRVALAPELSAAEGPFDVVVMMEVLEHIPDTEVRAVLASVRGALAPGGRLVLTVPSVNVPLNAKHYRHYDEALLRAQTDGLFRLAELGWVHRTGAGSRMLARLVHNRVFTLEFPPLLRLATRLYRTRMEHATAADGAHLLAVLEPEPGEAPGA